jgi:DNA-binding phage protein
LLLNFLNSKTSPTLVLFNYWLSKVQILAHYVKYKVRSPYLFREHGNFTLGSDGQDIGRKSFKKSKNADTYISMFLEKMLRDLVKERGLRKTARDLGIDSGSLFRSLQDGSNLKLGRIEQLLDYFGYELKIVKRKEVKLDVKGRLSQDGNPNRR